MAVLGMVPGLVRSQETVPAPAAQVYLDAVTETGVGGTLAPSQLADHLKGARILLVGERHDSRESHRVQEEAIRLLHRAGRHVIVGLEMFPHTVERPLQDWSRGRMSEARFLDAADWYGNWGFPWRLYRGVFLAARETRSPLVGLNAPRDVIRAVRKAPAGELPAEARGHLPPQIAFDDPVHRAAFKDMISGGHGELSDELVDGMFRAQCAWDAAMAWHALRRMEHEPANSIMVVLVGEGHVTHGWGIVRQARALDPAVRVATLLTVPVGEAPAAADAAAADYLWGVPEEVLPAWPEAGFSAPEKDGIRVVADVEDGSWAAAAGLRDGDRLVSVDGMGVGKPGDMARILERKNWGDILHVAVERDGVVTSIEVPLRRGRARQTEPPAVQ